MTEEERDIDKALRLRGLDPTQSFIVRKQVIYVPCDDLREVEIFQFISSLCLLFGGVLLGVIVIPPQNDTQFRVCLGIGIALVIVGALFFYFGVHRQIGRWEKKKEAISVVK
jgi:hypothetical protein